MKKKKMNNKEAFSEGIAELVITLIFFGIGALIISLLGIGIDSDNIDFDLICLIGIGTVFVISVIVSVVAKWIKKSTNKKDK